MQFLIDILLAVSEILMVVIGALGLVLSALLRFNPAAISRWSSVLNRSIDLDRVVPVLNRPVITNGLTYNHPIIFGVVLVIGSVFVLHFLFFQLEASLFTGFFGGILFDALVIIGKLACLCGIGLGVALIFIPDKVKILEGKLDSWFDTEPLAQSLNRPISKVDHVFLRHPLLFGAIGLLASFVLLILSAANLNR